MSLFMRRGAGSLYPPARIACFVCGSDVPADYPLFTAPPPGSPANTPYFPFLRHQPAPLGCKSAQETNGVAKSCRVCYSALMRQWEEYERGGVPGEKRVYWLKRNETPPETTALIPPPPPAARSGSNNDNDSALDLSSGSRDRDTMKSRSSINSNISAATHYSSYQSGGAGSSSASNSDNMADLTLPDKNATHEVCYVCGDEFKKGALSYTFAKCVAKEPFYPSLLCHSRPAKSRPMDPSGRVLTCDECHLHLHQQWTQFESEDIPHADRNYSLRKRDQLSAYDSTIFVCYICALDYHSSCLRLLYSRANADNEPYYPFIEHQRPPPGASPISPQGVVQVCMVCYKSIKEKHQGFSKDTPPPPPPPSLAANSNSSSVEQPPPKKRRTTRPPPVPSNNNNDEVEVIGGSVAGVPYGSAVNSTTDEEYDNNIPADITCPLCRRKFSVGSFKHLHTLPPPAGGIPYFPFLTTLHVPDEERCHLMEEGPKKRVRACRSCTTSLINQWTNFQREQVSTEERQYSYSSQTVPRRTSLRGSPGGSPPPRPRSNSSSVPDAPIRARSNTSESRPRSGSPRTNLPCPSPSSVGNGDSSSSQLNKHSSSTSSFYCFLCGLHSELSFSRVLYSTAPAKKAPYFPFMKNHVPKPRAETLREDGTALVCTFCYHSVMSQWVRYNDKRGGGGSSLDVDQRKYDIHNFNCYVCGITTYRKRIRALRVVDFPFLRHHKSRNKEVITLENGEMVAVCLDCFESLRGQFSEGAKYGIPVDKRQYNWMQIPPPPPEESHVAAPPERIQKSE